MPRWEAVLRRVARAEIADSFVLDNEFMSYQRSVKVLPDCCLLDIDPDDQQTFAAQEPNQPV
jgi:hypothetical protein